MSCAAEEGKYEIVEYLLNRDVSSTGCGEGEVYSVVKSLAIFTISLSLQDIPGECQPLMLAAKCGQTNCVILLLEREANSLVQSSRGYNCLMEAISAGHRLKKNNALYLSKSSSIQKVSALKPLGHIQSKGFIYCTRCVCICLSVSLLYSSNFYA